MSSASKFYSQYNQDQFINRVVFPFKKNGFFLDIGAHDGIKFSNSYYFEKEMDWTGVCFEPNPIVFKRLMRNRTSRNYNVCVGREGGKVIFCQIEGYSEMLSGIKEFYNQKHLERIIQEIGQQGGTLTEIEVPVIKLEFISELKNKTIDFVSIDTEGNELSILESIDFNNFNIASLSIENNYSDSKIVELMRSKNYTKIIRLGTDEIYIKSELSSFVLTARIFLWRFLSKVKSIMARK